MSADWSCHPSGGTDVIKLPDWGLPSCCCLSGCVHSESDSDQKASGDLGPSGSMSWLRPHVWVLLVRRVVCFWMRIGAICLVVRLCIWSTDLAALRGCPTLIVYRLVYMRESTAPVDVCLYGVKRECRCKKSGLCTYCVCCCRKPL
jgi:hypothetical protein